MVSEGQAQAIGSAFLLTRSLFQPDAEDALQWELDGKRRPPCDETPRRVWNGDSCCAHCLPGTSSAVLVRTVRTRCNRTVGHPMLRRTACALFRHVLLEFQ